MPKAKTQNDYRRAMTALDQFGRKWSMMIEVSNGCPTGGVRPAGWRDPLRTQEKYLSVPKEHGQPIWGRISLNFEQWVEDQQAAERDWKVRLWEIGQEKQGVKFDASTAEQDDYLLHLTGPKPWPSSVALLEAAAGDTALLGLSPMTRHAREMLNIVAFEDIVGPLRGKVNTPEPEAERIPVSPKTVEPTAQIGGGGPTTYQQFVKETMKAGLVKSVKECAALWQQRKAAMAAAEGEG